MGDALKKNLQYSEKYKQRIANPTVPRVLRVLINRKNVKNILDLGCGDGAIITSIKRDYNEKKIWGVDISPKRINRLKEKFNNFDGCFFLCKDVCNTGLKKKFDILICTQVIEHVDDDKKLVKEIYRLEKKSGYLYITSVIKKPWAIYRYRNKGRFVLDPTHEREYKNKEEFISLFKNKFRLLKLFVFPVTRKKIFTFRIPGYYIIETLWKKE